MMPKKMPTYLIAFVFVFLFIAFAPTTALAHCDGLDGPVVKAAIKALATSDINLVLIWVQEKDEAEIKEAFQKTLAVRTLAPEANALADRYFFETLVRVHRAGEGAPYTGLQPAGRDLGPAIPAADAALDSRSAAQLLDLLTGMMRNGLSEHFKDALVLKDFQPSDLESGREYVRRYVEFIHYVERLYESIQKPVEGHLHEGDEAK